MRRALVTGSHGFAGTHLRRLLRQEGWRVAGLGRSAAEPGPEETYHRADLTVVSEVRRAVDEARPEVVFHLAGETGRGDASAARRAIRSNVTGTLTLLEVLVDRGHPVRLVSVGSSAQYGAVPAAENPIDENCALRAEGVYGWSKAAAEALALSCHGIGKVEVVAVRPFNHTGPGEPTGLVCSAFAEQIARIEAGGDPVISVGNLEPVRDFADVRDIVRGYLAAAERGEGRRVYNLCSGRGVKIADVLAILLDKTEAAIEVRADQARMRANDLPTQVGDAGRAQQDLDWSVAIPLEVTLEDLLDDWRQRTASTSKGVPS